jgi:hypothetical protein
MLSSGMDIQNRIVLATSYSVHRLQTFPSQLLILFSYIQRVCSKLLNRYILHAD